MKEINQFVDAKDIKLPPCEINHRYLLYFSCTLSLFSTFSFGLAISEAGQVVYILAQKLGWEEETYFNPVVLCLVSGPLGIACGYLLAVKLSVLVGGPKRAFLLSNFIAIIMNVIKIIETTPTILIGRFGFGVCSGI